MFLFIYVFGCPEEPNKIHHVFAPSFERATEMMKETGELPGSSDPLSLVLEYPVESGVAGEGRVVFSDAEEIDIALSPFFESVADVDGDIRR